MISKKLIISLALSVISTFSAYAETQFTKHTAYSKDGVIVESRQLQSLNSVQYLSSNEEQGGGTVGELPPENVPDETWAKYITFNITARVFTNKSNECRIVVLNSANTEGVNQLYHRKVLAGANFGYPPSSPLKYPYNQGANMTRGPIKTYACDEAAPGIAY